jgi:hypothetical protein
VQQVAEGENKALVQVDATAILILAYELNAPIVRDLSSTVSAEAVLCCCLDLLLLTAP